MAYFDNRDLFVNQDIDKSITSEADVLNEKAAAMEGFASYVNEKTVLDLGCADGRFCSWFLDKGASKVHGVDIEKNYIDNAKVVMANYFTDDKYSFEVGDIVDSSFSVSNYDVVALFNTLTYKSPFLQIQKACELANDCVLYSCAKEFCSSDTGEIITTAQVKNKFNFSGFNTIIDLDDDLVGRSYFIAKR